MGRDRFTKSLMMIKRLRTAIPLALLLLGATAACSSAMSRALQPGALSDLVQEPVGNVESTDPADFTDEPAPLAAKIRSDVRRLPRPVSAGWRSIESVRAARANPKTRSAASLRVVISLGERRLSVMSGKDTVHNAAAGVATGLRLAYAGRSWTFRTPRGQRTVLRKTTEPVWRPPDWHYAEAALEHGLKMVQLSSRDVIRLRNGNRLLIKNGRAGLIFKGEKQFEPLPTEEHIVFEGKLYIPPVGTENRKVTRALGAFGFDLGDGYLIHGTPDEASIGQASTHGCIRLREEDLAWLYEYIPVGTPVVII